MALDALEHRDVAKIDRMLEGFVGLVTRLAFAIGKAPEVNRMLERDRLRRRGSTSSSSRPPSAASAQADPRERKTGWFVTCFALYS